MGGNLGVRPDDEEILLHCVVLPYSSKVNGVLDILENMETQCWCPPHTGQDDESCVRSRHRNR